MGFRRNRENEHRWTIWLDEHRQVIDECGLPPVVLQSETNWCLFLQEGYVPQGFGEWSGWKVTMLSRGEARKLYEFLTSDAIQTNWHIHPALLRELRDVLT